VSAQGLPKDERIRKGDDFTRIIREGTRTRGKLLDARWCAREDAGDRPNRVGIAVGRRLGNAAARNRMKRRIREAYRHNKRGLSCRGTDIVFFATPLLRGRSAPEVEGEMQQLLQAVAHARDGR
jgi:ribonuclease P protein component